MGGGDPPLHRRPPGGPGAVRLRSRRLGAVGARWEGGAPAEHRGRPKARRHASRRLCARAHGCRGLRRGHPGPHLRMAEPGLPAGDRPGPAPVRPRSNGPGSARPAAGRRGLFRERLPRTLPRGPALVPKALRVLRGGRRQRGVRASRGLAVPAGRGAVGHSRARGRARGLRRAARSETASPGAPETAARHPQASDAGVLAP
mmetsp:Transcript_18386/g.61523  ORF Transcript_18386/g.61523 Transcript_18386/m.61523 type:complete len:202 (-) Transcript_18386:180-785(-)